VAGLIGVDEGDLGRSADDSLIPKRSFIQSLAVPMTIQFIGEPADLEEVMAIVAPEETELTPLLASAWQHWLIEFSHRNVLSLTNLGRRCVGMSDSTDTRRARIESYLQVWPYKVILSNLDATYRGVPSIDEVSSMLWEFPRLGKSDYARLMLNYDRDFCQPDSLDIADVKEYLHEKYPSRQEPGMAVPRTPPLPTPKCFVAMPFTEHNNQYKPGFFNEVLTTLLEPAIKLAGFQPVTARKDGSDIIHATIVNNLLDADLVVVDLTEHNPNVLFELGMRMHADKPVALIKAKGTGRIFDVDSLLRVAEYDPRLWATTVASDIKTLSAHIKGAWDARYSSQTYMGILKRK
jgi:hypothetical protein